MRPIITITILTASLLSACGSGFTEAPPPAPPPVVTAQTAYANQIQQSETAGRAVYERYQALSLGEAPPLSQAEQRAVRAAAGADVLRCAEEYEAIPLSSDVPGGLGEGLIAVYLVPEPGETSTVPVGGFARVTVDEETGQVLHTASMTQSCLDLSLAPERQQGRAAARVNSLLVSHEMTPYPLENHVFASLTHRVELIVVTPGTTWRVAQGDVRALD